MALSSGFRVQEISLATGSVKGVKWLGQIFHTHMQFDFRENIFFTLMLDLTIHLNDSNKSIRTFGKSLGYKRLFRLFEVKGT